MTATIVQSGTRRPFAGATVGSPPLGNHQRPVEPLGESIFVRAGSPLYREEDEATYLYKIIAGAVRAFTFTEGGRRQVNGLYFGGDSFGSAQLGHYRSSVEAITDCTLVRFRQDRRETAAKLGFDRFVLDVALAEIRAAEQQILMLGRMSACAKVAAFILHLADRISRGESCATAVSIPMTRYDIADFLGLSAESVSRCLTKLKRRGMIEMDAPDEVKLVDREALVDVPRGF